MLPGELTSNQFLGYPPRARQLATDNLALLKKLPLVFLPLLLREVKAYDWKFPAEQNEVDVQFAFLNSLSEDDLRRLMEGFSQIQISPELSQLDWVNSPEVFSHYFAAALWATNQNDAFRTASISYVNEYRRSAPVQPLPVKRLTMVVVGQGVQETRYPVFRRLRGHGVSYSAVDPGNGLERLLAAATARAHAHPIPFAHWYVDGGSPVKTTDSGLTCMSYESLSPLRVAVLREMRTIMRMSKGPEKTERLLAGLEPGQFEASVHTEDPILSHFQLSIFAEGSGTQFYSTTFAQWTAHELLRRAQPLTALVRFAPRQVQRPMDEMMADSGENFPVDPEGSLVDADMGAYYIWLNQRRLGESNQASFLAWFEGHRQAIAISPSLPAGTESHEPTSIARLLETVT
ncbi:MAG TPA: hypothetical protein VGR96_08735 [Acidobacteriaceae bacterium]|nr:hypothetical protein [Acidobacteriaceae bacterium]